VISVDVYSAVVSVATVALYSSYGLPIAARLIARARGLDPVRGPWNLGRWSTLNAVVALSWIVFITSVFVLPPNEIAGKALGVSFLVLLAIWGFVAGHRFDGPQVQFGLD